MLGLKDLELTAVGKIVGAHGIWGEFKILPLTDFPERFKNMEEIKLYEALGSHKLTLRLLSVRFQVDKGLVLVRAENVNTREEAEALRGLIIKIKKEERVSLPEGHYWIDDLIGLSVKDSETLEELGHIKDVFVTGGVDVFLVETSVGEEKMIPAAKEMISSIDLEKQEMLVSLLEGLWD